jgi:hypothetical protein
VRRGEWLGVPAGVAIVTLGLTGVTAVATPIVTSAYTVTVPHVIDAHIVHRLGFSYAGIWPETLREGQRTLDAHRGPRGEPPTLWSTYAGWIEARNGIFHPSFDYIIHALGPDNRRAYLESLRATRPQLVQTVSPAITQYEDWIENNSWPVYDELLRSYVVTSTSPWSFFWERRPSPAPEPVIIGAMVVPSGMTEIPLPPIPDSLRSPITLLVVDVGYETYNPLRWLPVIGASPRYLIGVDGALRSTTISLAPYDTLRRFPIFVDPSRPSTMFFRTVSLLPGASFRPLRLVVSVARVDERNAAWVEAVAR